VLEAMADHLISIEAANNKLYDFPFEVLSGMSEFWSLDLSHNYLGSVSKVCPTSTSPVIMSV
jgi:hypothetical protein